MTEKLFKNHLTDASPKQQEKKSMCVKFAEANFAFLPFMALSCYYDFHHLRTQNQTIASKRLQSKSFGTLRVS